MDIDKNCLKEKDTVDDVKFWLQHYGFSEAVIQIFYENEVDGFALLNMKENDVMLMLANKLGAARKILVLLENEKSCAVLKQQAGPSSATSNLADNILLTNYTAENICIGGRSCGINTSMPTFSERVKSALEDGNIQPHYNRMIEEAAYHIKQNGDMKDKGGYCNFAKELFNLYPCIGFPGEHPWSHFTKKLSQKLRNIRWKENRKSDSPKTARVSKSVKLAAVPESEEFIVDCKKIVIEELKKPKEKQDCALVKKTFTLSHSSRRIELASIGNGSVMKIVEQFPLLRKIEFIRIEFDIIYKFEDAEGTFAELMSKLLPILLPNFKEDSDDDNISSEDLIIKLVMKLQSAMDLNGKGKKLVPAISFMDADKVELSSPRLCPPHIVIVEGTKNKSQGFILADGIHVTCGIKSISELITDLLAVYYVWDLSFPKRYQILTFFQLYLLNDSKGKSNFKSTKMAVIEKKYLDSIRS